MSVKKMTSDDVVMFEPSDRSMLIDYPELANYPEFNNSLKFSSLIIPD